jgi:hypothetical protein
MPCQKYLLIAKYHSDNKFFSDITGYILCERKGAKFLPGDLDLCLRLHPEIVVHMPGY